MNHGCSYSSIYVCEGSNGEVNGVARELLFLLFGKCETDYFLQRFS